MYLSSSNVYVFPSAIDRKAYFPYSKSFTEENIRKLITSAALWPSAILSCTDAQGRDCSHRDININETIQMEVLLDGYYVKVKINPSTDFVNYPPNSPVYLCAVVDHTVSDFPQLYGDDKDGQFRGIQLTYDPNSGMSTPTSIPSEKQEKIYIQVLKFTNATTVRCYLKNWKYQLEGGSYN